MAAKHAAEGTDSLSAPPAAPEQANATTADEAVAMLREGLGPMEWERTYTEVDGWFVDVETGESYKTIPTGNPYSGPAT